MTNNRPEEVVSAIYSRILNRRPDVDGLRDYSASLIGGCTVKQIIRELANHKEFANFNINGKTEDEIISRLYDCLLAREPDLAGLKDWKAMLSTEGLSLVIDGIMASDEYSRKFGEHSVQCRPLGDDKSPPRLFYYYVPPSMIPADTRFILAISGVDCQVYCKRIDGSGNPEGPFFLVGDGTAKMIKSVRLRDGSRLLIAISGGDDQVYAKKLSPNGDPLEPYFLIGQGPATCIDVTLDAVGCPIVFAISPGDHRPYSLRMNKDGRPTGGYVPVGVGTAKLVCAGSCQDGSPLLFAVSGGDDQLYVIRFDQNGAAIGNFSLVDGGKVAGISTGYDAFGNPFIVVIGGSDEALYSLKLGPNGERIGHWVKLGEGTGKVIKLQCKRGRGPLLFVVSGGNDEVYAMQFSDTGERISGYYTVDPTTNGKAMILRAGLVSGKPILFAVSGAETYRSVEGQEPELVISNGDRHLYAMRFDDNGNPISGYYKLGDGTVAGMDNNMAVVLMAVGIVAVAVAVYGPSFYGLYKGYQSSKLLEKQLKERDEQEHEQYCQFKCPNKECKDDLICGDYNPE